MIKPGLCTHSQYATYLLFYKCYLIQQIGILHFSKKLFEILCAHKPGGSHVESHTVKPKTSVNLANKSKFTEV